MLNKHLRPSVFIIFSLVLSLSFIGCGSDSNGSLAPQKQEVYTNSDGSLHRSDVNKFNGRKTLPRKCGDLPF